MLMFKNLDGVSSCVWEQMDTGRYVYGTPGSPLLHTTLYGSAAGCRSIQNDLCSLKAWIDFQKYT